MKSRNYFIAGLATVIFLSTLKTANADSFTLTYSFSDGEQILATFNGNTNGIIVTDIKNVSAWIDGYQVPTDASGYLYSNGGFNLDGRFDLPAQVGFNQTDTNFQFQTLPTDLGFFPGNVIFDVTGSPYYGSIWNHRSAGGVILLPNNQGVLVDIQMWTSSPPDLIIYGPNTTLSSNSIIETGYSLIQNTSTVPLPSSILLFGTILLGFLGLKRRKY